MSKEERLKTEQAALLEFIARDLQRYAEEIRNGNASIVSNAFSCVTMEPPTEPPRKQKYDLRLVLHHELQGKEEA